jgi:ribosome-associated protein
MPTNQAHQQTRILVQAAAAACDDKKGEDTRILELDPMDSGLSDFFLVTSASNDRQAVAIADEIEHRLKHNFDVVPNSVEGRRHGEWILLDYVDFVVHVFSHEKRLFYNIERLRKSARTLSADEMRKALTERTVAVRAAKPAAAAKKPAAKPKKSAVTAKQKKSAGKKGGAKKSPAKKKTTGKKPAGKKSGKPAGKRSTAKKSGRRGAGRRGK